MVCFHVCFCIVGEKMMPTQRFSVQLKFQNRMASPVPWAHVPTDHGNSNLS